MKSNENSLNLTQKFAQLVIDQASRTQGAGLHEQLVKEVSTAIRPDLGKLHQSIDVLRQDVSNRLRDHQNELSAFRQRGIGSHDVLSEQLRELASSSQTMNQKLMTRLGVIESQLAEQASSQAQGFAPQLDLDLQTAPAPVPLPFTNTKPESSGKGPVLAYWAHEYGKPAAAFALGVLLTLALVWLKGDKVPAPGQITAPASGGSGHIDGTKESNGVNAGSVETPHLSPDRGYPVKTTEYVRDLADILRDKVTDPRKVKYLKENVLARPDDMPIEVLEQVMQGQQAPTIAAYFYQALALKEGKEIQKIDGALDANGKTMNALRQIPCVSDAPNLRNPGESALLNPADNLVSVINYCANR